MGHFHAIPDAVAVAADRLVAVVRVDSDGGVVVRDLANGRLATICASELRAPPALSDLSLAPALSLAQATDAQWELARRREAVIAEMVNANDLANQVTRASAGLGISHRTVFRWLAAYRNAPQTSSLLARPRGTPTGARRIDTRLEQLIAEVIRDVYLTKVRAKKEEVVRQVGLLRIRTTGTAIAQGHPRPRTGTRHARGNQGWSRAASPCCWSTRAT